MKTSVHITRESRWKQFKRDRGVLFAFSWLILIGLTALLADVLAHNPEKGWAPVPYGTEITYGHKNIPPFGPHNHYLGTDYAGHDLLAGLIHGARISLSVGLAAVSIAALIGILLGVIAGYWGDDRLYMRRGVMLSMLPAMFFAWFYGFRVRRYEWEDAVDGNLEKLPVEIAISIGIAILTVFLWLLVGKIISYKGYMAKKITFPADSLIMRAIEILNSLPLLLLIISLSAIFERSLGFITIMIGLLGWTGLARLIRAETLRVIRMGYIESGKALGLGAWRIVFRHVVPNAIPPALIVIAFGIGNAIIAESALSFLNLVDGTVTWGSLLSSTRNNFSIWWVGVFPGLAIFLTVLSFNLIGEKLRDIFDPHLPS
ncbi:MAG: ABC transporter permease [Bacteroidia bacterium]